MHGPAPFGTKLRSSSPVPYGNEENTQANLETHIFNLVTHLILTPFFFIYHVLVAINI
jgi:hypothetical protein